jgi:hypothetical protein
MSDFSEAYGILFIGIVVLMAFFACYEVIIYKSEIFSRQLGANYLASMFKSDLAEYDGSNYNNSFVLPKLDFVSQEIVEVVSHD